MNQKKLDPNQEFISDLHDLAIQLIRKFFDSAVALAGAHNTGTSLLTLIAVFQGQLNATTATWSKTASPESRELLETLTAQVTNKLLGNDSNADVMSEHVVELVAKRLKAQVGLAGLIEFRKRATLDVVTEARFDAQIQKMKQEDGYDG